MTQAFPSPRAAALAAALALPFAVPALALAAAAPARGERTPVDLSGGAHAAHVGGGGSIVRTIVGLAIVIGVIYGLAWVLRQVKAGRQERATGVGLASVASVPLGQGRSVQLVRAGCELVLVGVAEHGITPLRVYREDEARDAGLIDDDGAFILPVEIARTERAGGARISLPALRAALPRLALPAPDATSAARPARAPRAPRAGSGGLLDTLRAWTVRQ
jgi:flagellar protein FliO/FliZ